MNPGSVTLRSSLVAFGLLLAACPGGGAEPPDGGPSSLHGTDSGTGVDAGTLPLDSGTPAAKTAHLRFPWAAGGGTTVGTVDWAAFQDGSGPWKRVSTTDGTFTLSVTDPSGHYRFAAHCQADPASASLVVLDLTVDELPSVFAKRMCQPVSTPLFTQSVKSLNWPPGTSQKAQVNYGPGNSTLLASEGATGSVHAPRGSYDILAQVGSTTATGVDATRGLIVPNVAVTSTGSRTLDFAQGFNFQTFGVSFASVPEDLERTKLTQLVTRGGIATVIGASNDIALPAKAVPVSALGTAFNIVEVVGSGPSGKYRGVTVGLPTVQSVSLTGPAYLETATASAAVTTPSVLPKFEWSGAPSSALFFGAAVVGNQQWLLISTPAARGGDAVTSAVFPDLSAIDGWSDDWALPAGVAGNFLVLFDSPVKAGAASVFESTFNSVNDRVEFSERLGDVTF